MKKITLLLLIGLAMIVSKTDAQTDDRHVSLGGFAEYYLYPSAKVQGDDAFAGAFGGGLKLYLPVYGTTSNVTGDFTIAAGYIDWFGSTDKNFNSYPDWGVFQPMAGFRFGLFDALSFEPQVGYSYGNFSNTYYKYSSQQVSGLTYDLQVGITIRHGLEIYGRFQSTKTTAFGSTFDYGAGVALHL